MITISNANIGINFLIVIANSSQKITVLCPNGFGSGKLLCD